MDSVAFSEFSLFLYSQRGSKRDLPIPYTYSEVDRTKSKYIPSGALLFVFFFSGGWYQSLVVDDLDNLDKMILILGRAQMYQ